ncbi:5-oxoprolinase/urea amidolyase family protein [Burkholderia sp. BE12]|uniref:5-oxoprolinase subunit B/C family protein n=1 Tax=Burkholderia sp. BE12 TaxID=2082394 RepID=UPI000CF37982|nr:urea amidolyase family protein [Burkholderia sp. BE12]
MPEQMRILSAGSAGVLVELESLEMTLALFDRLLASEVEGVDEVIPGARTVLVRFDPVVIDRAALIERLGQLDVSVRRERSGNTFDIPVSYDGQDLGEVAELLGWSVAELVQRHLDAAYSVAFTGFAPGFAYMTADDPGFDVPRRKAPRVRIPAGSVAIAGTFSGIYPSDSPGGWQLLGTTQVPMWDVTRPRAALLAPGDRVRFRDARKGAAVPVPERLQPTPVRHVSGSGILVTRADRPVLYQDLGRPRQGDQGVSVCGAVDSAALRIANACVGNPGSRAALEVTFGGLSLVPDRAVTLAVTGAPCPISIRDANGRVTVVPHARPFAVDAGEEVTLDIPGRGMRSYVALRGGFVVERTLGSASTDTLSRIGPAPIARGDVLVPADEAVTFVEPEPPATLPLPRAGDTIEVDVVPGPRTDWFTDDSVTRFLSQEWRVTTESSRVGMRLVGDLPLQRRDDVELPSEGTLFGSIQVPHSGQPVLFLTDHPVTGGYPVIAVVAANHLGMLGQIPIGARIRFNPISAFDPQVKELVR